MSNNGVDFDFSGVLASLERKQRQVERAAVTEMGDCMDDLLGKSTEIAPLDKGPLRNTAWTEIETDGSVVEGSVTFSIAEKDRKGGNFNYALKVHEMGEYKNPTTPGTRPKFLSEPLKANAATYKQRIADAIKAVISG